jgi:hypothetical protein
VEVRDKGRENEERREREGREKGGGGREKGGGGKPVPKSECCFGLKGSGGMRGVRGLRGKVRGRLHGILIFHFMAAQGKFDSLNRVSPSDLIRPTKTSITTFLGTHFILNAPSSQNL